MHRNIAFIFVHIVLLNIGVFINAHAQQHDTVNLQTFRVLDSVTVKGSSIQYSSSNRKFSTGTNIIRVSQESLSNMQMSSLAEFIQKENAVYLKEYGRGMGAFISVRGTSSSHTTIDWNGQSLSIPTMGQTDLSHIPLYFFDGMEIHIGGNSALYGDGSIGGSIQLSTKPKWERGIHGDILLSAGSFYSYIQGVTLRHSSKTIESRTSILHSAALNNYPFLNNTKIGRPTERLNNSSFDNYGLLQEVYKKFKDSSLLTATLMYQNFDRQIQPSVSSNDRSESFESIYDKNLKLNIGYNASKHYLSYGAKASYAYDNQRYKEDEIAAGRFFSSVYAEYRFDKLTIKGGLSGEYIKPDVYSYADSVMEVKVNLYTLLRFVPFDRLVISGGIRYSKVTNSVVPLMPSLDAKYLIVRSANHIVAVRGSISQNSKVPSLNDRYWGGEHLYLRSERSLTTECGADYSWFSGAWSVDLFGTIYRSSVKDWIRWLPAGVVWRPQNIPEVLSRGAEAGARLSGRIADWNLSMNFSYASTNVTMIKAAWQEDPAIGQQLAYQPKHSWRTTVMLRRGAASMFGGLYFTGKRTTIDIFDTLPSYLLTDLGAMYGFKIFGLQFTANGVIKNIFDVSYQNVKFYAMPGRNWQVSFQWRF